MILEPGTFSVKGNRKAIPDWVKIVCAIRAHRKLFVPSANNIYNPERLESLAAWVKSLRFDHRPPLQDRPYDTEKKDFVPPQNDPDYIEAVHTKVHDHRTFGRKPDAEKTVTTKGSDAFERKHTRKLKDSQARHDVQMAMKRGDPQAISRILGTVKPEKPKRKWPKRSFQRSKRRG